MYAGYSNGVECGHDNEEDDYDMAEMNRQDNEEGDYDMAEITKAASHDTNNATKVNNANKSNVNQSTEESAVVQNPYYGGLNDGNLENTHSNGTIEDAAIVQKTQNPYYADMDNITGLTLVNGCMLPNN